MTARPDWWAVHVFLFDAQESEACLIDDIMPSVRDLVSRGRAGEWFFIRYWEGGPHMRLRLAQIGADDRLEFLGRLRAKVATRRSGAAITREEYYREHPMDGEAVDIDTLPWYGDGTVEEISYVPETMRYGGPAALRLSERLFKASSELAVAIVGATRDDFNKRMGAAFVLMVAAAAVAGRDANGIATFCEHYAAMWVHHSRQSRAAADNPLPPPSPGHLDAVASVLAGRPMPSAFAQRWHGALSGFRDELERLGREGTLVSPVDGSPVSDDNAIDHAIVAILWSQMHMLNNRLAVPPAQEVFLARAVAAVARRHVESGASLP